MGARPLSFLLFRRKRPSVLLGILVGTAFVAVETSVAYVLRPLVAFAGSLVAVYLIGVLVVSAVWGLWLAVPIALISSVAYDYCILPPAGRSAWDDPRRLITLSVFLVAALLTSALTAWARSMAVEAEQRRREADLFAELARLLLRVGDLRSALPQASGLLARELAVPGLTVALEPVAPADGRIVLPLQDDGAQVGMLVLPETLPDAVLRRLRERLVPSLETFLRAARRHEAVGIALRESHDELRRIADKQTALRRVATLVARQVPPEEVFRAVAEETGRLLGADSTAVARHEDGTEAAIVGSWSAQDPRLRPLPGSRWAMNEEGMAALRSGRPHIWTAGTGHGLLDRVPSGGITCAVTTPITAGGRDWGALCAFFRGPPPDGVAGRMLDFSDLAATAISNAQARAELAASRARVVAASDETRRRIGRDLHDGVQQRLVSLALQLRTAEALAPFEPPELRRQMSQTAQGLLDVLTDLQELSRGLHPAIIARGGLGPALRTIARRSAVPVELTIEADRRPPEHIEVAIYFTVSEALTNVAKHAGASVVHVELHVDRDAVRLLVRDDGAGGADTRRGSGLIGLQDRIEALGGHMEIDSPAGHGTSLSARIPIPAG